jgi:hypothetical protein
MKKYLYYLTAIAASVGSLQLSAVEEASSQPKPAMMPEPTPENPNPPMPQPAPGEVIIQ